MIEQQQKLVLSPYMEIYELVVPKDNLLRQIKELVSHFNYMNMFCFEGLIPLKKCADNDTMMIPNEAFLKYFLDAVLAGMKIYSDASVSDFFKSITKDKSTGFLNEWNAKRNRGERIYISYDSTNKNCQAEEIELAEFGHAKTDIGLAIINYSVGYDLKNKEPLFYEAYPRSINDVSQLRAMLGKITGYGYKKIDFILDRGYFSRGNIVREKSY